MESGRLLIDLTIALATALVGAAVALRFRQPLILGYIFAGVAISPFTPGFIGPTDAIAELAEIGVIFLMFVIGLQFPLRELLRTSRIAVVGGLSQVAIMIALGYGVGWLLGWSHLEAYAFGAVISNSSSTVLSKILTDRGEAESRHAQLALAWSSVQDISTVALVAALDIFGRHSQSAGSLVGRGAIFFFGLVPLAFWILPWVLRHAATHRSREFFALTVTTVAISMAGGAALLGVSLALGAFLAGIVVGESDLTHRILGDALPPRDVFSGIFFVSIGTLLDPRFVAEQWPLVLLTVGLIVIVKGFVSSWLCLWLGCSTRLAVLVGALLAQSGEFSFLMARSGLAEGALTRPVFNLLMSSAVVSIVLSPLGTHVAPSVLRWMKERPAREGTPVGTAPEGLRDHAIVCGYGRVGSIVCKLLELHGKPFVVVEEDLRLVDALRTRGVAAIFGDAAQAHVLDRAQLATARLLIVCIPERMAVRRALDHARETNTSVMVLARTHSEADQAFLKNHGVDDAVVGETELAIELARRALERFDVERDDVEQSVARARRAIT